MIKKDIKNFQQTMLMENIDTPNVSKQNHLNLHSSVLVKHSSVKSSSNMFGCIWDKMRKEKKMLVTKLGKYYEQKQIIK